MWIKTGIGILLSMSLIAMPVTSFAQARPQAPSGRNQAEGTQLSGTRKQLATIIFSGLAGAILGLSTLSFYGRPQEKLNNIAVGAALGVIAGTVYTTYRAATAPYEVYDFGDAWIDLKKPSREMPMQPALPQLAYTWEF